MQVKPSMYGITLPFPWVIVALVPGQEFGYLLAGALVLLGTVGVLHALTAEFWSERTRAAPAEAVLALAIAVNVALGGFAEWHYQLSESNPHNFSQPLGKVGAIYYTLTVFSTTGFGDIHPVSNYARLVTSGQMFFGMVVVLIALAIAVGRLFPLPLRDR